MPAVTYQRHDLEYPPWTLDFDPYNRGYLVVGGGGGQNQKEVPNKLTLLDVSQPDKISQLADLDVKDDSPSSLGLLAAKDGLFVLAGINASTAEQRHGKNAHLRSYKAEFPVKKKDSVVTSGSISALGKNQLFSKDYLTNKDAFQRVLRLSPSHIRPDGNKRIGAIASSFAAKSEIVVFDATVASPTTNDVLTRIEPPENAEANDLDIFESAPESFILAYCTSTTVHCVSVAFDFGKRKLSSKVEPPTLLHQIHSRPAKIRGLRFIAADLLLLLVNRAGESELLLLRTYAKGGPGDVILRRKLPKKLGSAVSMDVSILDADPLMGERQVVVAIAAQRNDINIFTIDIPGKGNPTAIKLFLELKDAHDASMKKVVLSSFHAPSATAKVANIKAMKGKEGEKQILRLASISLSNTLVVETLPLQPWKNKSKGERYILSNTSIVAGALSGATTLFSFAFVVLSIVLFIQSYLDMQAAQGSMQQYHLIPVQIRQFMSSLRRDRDPVKQIIHDSITSKDSPVQRIADLLSAQNGKDASSAGKPKAIVVRVDGSNAGDIAAGLEHHQAAHADPESKRWDELSKKQQDSWKRKLIDAGHWSVDEGETILKSIFFSEVAGAIGRAAMGAVA